MEKHGAFQLLICLIIVVVVGVFTKIYFEGPSCPSSTKLTGTFFYDAHSQTSLREMGGKGLIWIGVLTLNIFLPADLFLKAGFSLAMESES